MWRSTTILAACALAYSLAVTPAVAKKLPCGDYDGVPSHNDCAPVSKALMTKCQKYIDKGNATDDPKEKNKYKHKYFHCVGY